MAAVEAVADRLVHEPPRVEFVVLGPRIRENALLRRKNFDGHVAHLTQRLALERNVLVRPAEELEYRAALPALELRAIGNFGAVPDKINVIQ